MKTAAKPSNRNPQQTEEQRIAPKMPRFTLAELLDTLKAAHEDYKVEPKEPLTQGWDHMQHARGWK